MRASRLLLAMVGLIGVLGVAGAAAACFAAAGGVSWGTAIKVPGTAALNTGDGAGVDSGSCASTGKCAAGGRYRNGSGGYRAFVTAP